MNKLRYTYEGVMTHVAQPDALIYCNYWLRRHLAEV